MKVLNLETREKSQKNSGGSLEEGEKEYKALMREYVAGVTMDSELRRMSKRSEVVMYPRYGEPYVLDRHGERGRLYL
jgi:hypothetical protein